MQAVDFMGQYLDWKRLISSTLSKEIMNEAVPEGTEGIVLAGMGGSGIVSDIVYEMLKQAVNVPLTIVKDFELPRWARKGWVVIGISYSGNTMETIEVIRKALNRGCFVSAVTSGGKLAELMIREGYPLIKIPGGRAPRSSLPALLTGVLRLLEMLSVERRLSEYVEKAMYILDDEKFIEMWSEKLVKHLSSKIPVWVVNQKYYPLALRAKDEFNENSKTLSLINVYPESAHNDIVGWERWFGPVASVVFREEKDEILAYIAKYMQEQGVIAEEILLEKATSPDAYLKNVLLWSQIVGVASVKTAINRGINPAETRSILDYKEFIKKLRSK